MANNQIALLAQMPELDTPFESQGKALQLRQLMNAGMVQDMDMQTKRQAIADDAATRDIYAKNEDPAERIKALYRVNPKAAMAAQKAQFDLDKIGADVTETKAKTTKVQGETAAQAFTMHRNRINLVNTPQDAAQWVQEAFTDPVTGPIVSRVGTLEAALSKIPKDPQAFQQWKLQAGLAADEYVKHTSPDANALLSSKTSLATNAATNATSRANNQANVAATIRGQNMTDERAKASASPDGMLPDATVSLMAQQYLAGDTSVMQNLGRGAQGAQNIIKLRNEIARQTTGAGKGGADLAAQNAEYFGTKAGQRTAGTRIANVEMASNEAESLIPLARQASQVVARSGLLPFGKAQVMFDNQTNDPALRQFAAANNALVNVYSRAISPSGVPTVADKEHAREMISTAMDDKSYQAVLDQMQKEITAARSAPQAVRKAFNAAVTGKGGHGDTPAIPSGWSVKER